MTQSEVTSPNGWGRLARNLVLATTILFTTLAPAGAGAQGLPLLFDGKERLPRPDLSTITRLRFLTSTDFPPFNFTDQTGRLSGFHVDLARAICAELAIETRCQVQALPYGELDAALEDGQGEAVIAGVAATDDLRARFSFSRPFMMLPARFVVRRTASLDGDTAAALFGRDVGVVSATAHEAMLKAFFPDLKPVKFDDRAALYEALKSGKIDAAFADGLQMSFWVNSRASTGCCRMFDGPYFSERFLGEGLSIMLSPTDPRLAGAVDSALSALARDGRLQEIYQRYFPYDLYGTSAPIVRSGGQARR